MCFSNHSISIWSLNSWSLNSRCRNSVQPCPSPGATYRCVGVFTLATLACDWNITVVPSGDNDAPLSGTLLSVNCFLLAPPASMTHTSVRSMNSSSGLGVRVMAMRDPFAASS